MIDNFDRPNSTHLGKDWCEMSGAWSINSNTLQCDTEGVVVTTAKQPPPVNGPNYSYRIDFSIVDTASHWKIICKYVDVNNFDWVELFYVGSNIYPKFWRRVGGVDTVIMDPTNYPQGGFWDLNGISSLPFSICYSESEWSIASGQIEWTMCGASPATSLPVGCEGLVGFLKGDFNQFAYHIHWEADRECDTCTCFCWDGEDFSCIPETLNLSMIPIVPHLDCTSNPTSFSFVLKQSLPTEPVPPATPNYLASPMKWYWFSDPVVDFVSLNSYVWFRLECRGLGEFELIFLDYPSGAQTAPVSFPNSAMQFVVQNGPNGGALNTSVECKPLVLKFPDIEKFALQTGSGGPFVCTPFDAIKYEITITE